MAVGNAIVNTARFKPLTVAEWAAPLKEYATQQEATQQALMQLSADADEYERYIQENPNDPISAKYRQYLADIDKQVDDLTRYGMTPQSRSGLMNLFRDYNRAIKPVKTGVNAYQNYQKIRLQKDDGTLLGDPLTVQDFIENPERPYTFTKGSDVYNEAAKGAAALAHSRKQRSNPKLILGGQRYEMIDQTGYSPQEIQAWSKGELALPELDNLVESLGAKYKNVSKEELTPYILRGINDGMNATYDIKYHDVENKNYGRTGTGTGTGSGRNRKKTREQQLYEGYISQSNPTPGSNTPGIISSQAARQIIAGPQPNKRAATIYEQNPGIFVQPQTSMVIPGTSIPFTPRANTSSFTPYREVGALEASAEFYNRNTQNRSGYTTLAQKAQALNDALGLTERKKTNKNTLLIDDRKLKNLGTYAQTYFGKYRNYDEIPEDAKMQLVKRITAAGGENNLVGWGNRIKNDPQLVEMLAQMGWDEMSSTTPTVTPTANNANVLPRNEYEILRKAGVKFQNADGTPRSNEEILWDAWDLLPRQYNKYALTSETGAGNRYRQTATSAYLREFPNAGKIKTNEGNTITLKPSKEKGFVSFEGFAPAEFDLQPDLLRKGKKLMTLVDDGGDVHTVEIPLSRHEQSVIDSYVKDLRAAWLAKLVNNNILDEATAKGLNSLKVNDFLKYIEMHGADFGGLGFTIDDLIDDLDDALLLDNEQNFVPKNSETQGTAYND